MAITQTEAGSCIVHLTIDEQRMQCFGIQIHPDLKSIVPREKFLDNKNNKAQLILLLAETFQRGRISVQLLWWCWLVSAALNEATESSVEVRAEDTDVLVMVVHHRANHPVFLTTAKDTSYDVAKIREALPERYRHTLYSYIASLGVIPYQQFLGLANQLCSASSARQNLRGPWMCSEPRKVTSKLAMNCSRSYSVASEDLEDWRFDIFSKQACSWEHQAWETASNYRSCSTALSAGISPDQRLATATKSITGFPWVWRETRKTRLCTSPYNRSHCTGLPSEVSQMESNVFLLVGTVMVTLDRTSTCQMIIVVR